MVTGAANAEASLLLTMPPKGAEQSRRHGYLLNLLGIRQIAVLGQDGFAGLFPGAFNLIEKNSGFSKKHLCRTKIFFPFPPRWGTHRFPQLSNALVYCAYGVDTSSSIPQSSEMPKPSAPIPIQDVNRIRRGAILAASVESGTIKVVGSLAFLVPRTS